MEDKKLGVITLAGLVVSAMIGGGVYNLPENMASAASAGAIIIAWVVTGIGMWFIAKTFSILSNIRPEVTSGIYGYGELGFGKFMGFQVAWGYWICNVFANVGYAILLMDSFNYFFYPHFKGGNNLLSIICGSIVIWGMYFAVMAGVKQATFINNIGVVGKLIPLFIFILVLLFKFDFEVFTTNFWGKDVIPSLLDKDLGGIFPQVKSTMLITLWVFIGIEGAVVISSRARSQKEVGKATVIGFLSCLIMYAILSLLPLGILSQGHIAQLEPPSTGPVLAKIIGNSGNVIMNLGVIVALLSSWLVWTVMLASLPYEAAKAGTFPKIFAKENKNESPSYSLLVSSILMQICMIVVYFSNNAWTLMLSITGVMILPCYLICTLYLWKVAKNHKEYPENSGIKIGTALITGAMGSLYATWLIYAAGLNYLLVAAVIYALGIPMFRKARKEANDGEEIFNHCEKIYAAVIVIVAIVGVFYIIMDYKSLLG
ncbi:basic amino acid/polyamine antiporter [uncultured Cetobacterium sp.]|uniref:basic amino acid/polyamine antiporter n=2 Tax=uncultured Cetobacterium sp. TaxID=527638 RepID=UPI00261573B7|nr:basic amino acid/polyamine antiporter [uncultured Cetobacterium sp.]